MSTQHCFPRLVTLAAAITLCAGLVQQAEAQSPPATTAQATTVFDQGEWVVTPFVGVGFSGDLDNGTGLFGAALGYIWNARTALEGEVSFMPSSEASGLVQVDTKVLNVTANLRYHLTNRNTWRPYGAVGMGFGHTSVDVDTSTPIGFEDSDTTFIFNFGGGVERRVSDRLAFRGDLRYFFGSNLVPDYWRLAAGLSFSILD